MGDRVFSGSASAAGILILAVLAGVAVFLIAQSIPALTANSADLPGHKSLAAYIGPLLFGTLLAAIIALIVATPLAIGIALFITYYAPRRMAQVLGYVVDLLAAIPSIVFGFWGIAWLAPKLVPFYQWLREPASRAPLFARPPPPPRGTRPTA